MKHESGLLIISEKDLKSLSGIVSWPKIDINNTPRLCDQNYSEFVG